MTEDRTYTFAGGTLSTNIDGFKPMRGREIVQTAAAELGATPADMPGLWNLPGYPELTSAQLVQIFMDKPA